LKQCHRKLSTHFADIVVVTREANFWADAEAEGGSLIQATYVGKAVEHKIYCSNLIQEKV